MRQYLLFQTDQIDLENPALDFCLSLPSYETITEGDMQNGRKFNIQYQKDTYSVHFEEVPELHSHAFVIEARRGVSTGAFYKGFYQLLEDWIGRFDKNAWKTIEYFEAADLNVLIRNRTNRFLGRQMLVDYGPIHDHDSKVHETVRLDYKESELNLNGDRCIKAAATLRDTALPMAWKAICVRREFDDWDMTTRQFLPLTTDEAARELSAFEKEYRLKSCLPEGFKDGEKILRLTKGYGLSFLVLKNESLFFFEYDLSHW